MKVWVSRSRPGADRQAEDLRRAGHDPVVAPALAIEPTTAALPPGRPDLVIFLSEHAVTLGLPALRQRNALAGSTVLAVGPRTLERLGAEGVSAAAPRVATSEGLLGAPELADPRHKAVLLVCGAGGRDTLLAALRERGARVGRFVCYRRRPLTRLTPAVLDCDVIIAASGDGLRQVAKLWLAAGGRPDIPVLVPSARVAGLGVEVGLARLHDCRGADSDAWLRGLAHVQSAGGT